MPKRITHAQSSEEQASLVTAERRQRWRQFCRQCRQVAAEHERIMEEWHAACNAALCNIGRNIGRTGRLRLRFSPRPILPSPEFPEELRSLTCGARTRKGTPCQLTGLYSNGRCKLHGGLSTTGPTTPEGKRRSALNGRVPKRHRKQSP